MENNIQDIIRQAREVFIGLELERLSKENICVDRVNENPEAARYFLMFSEWGKVSPEEIFRDLNSQTAKETQVYVDFVFCGKFCDFCAFYGVVPKNYQEMKDYVDCLNREVNMLQKAYFSQGFSADALEFGGGTPTFLPIDLLKEATEAILGKFPFIKGHEFNFEVSPETVVGDEGLEKLKYLKRMGADRMSIGVQSFNDKILQQTNRPHNASQTRQAIENARLSGFKRINLDLMVGLYKQTIEDFLISLDEALRYGVEIIELYVMRYFDTKTFVPMKYKLEEQGAFLPPEEILVARIAADLMLHKAGYSSSNGRTYEKKDSKSTFYAAYYEGNFKGKNTLGVGRKSNSNIYPWQYANYRNLEKYKDAINSGKLPIATAARFTPKARSAKLLTGMFQLPQDIDYHAFRQSLNGQWVLEFDRLMEKFSRLGLIEEQKGKYRKTFLGFLFIEELLKQIYELAVTPYNISSLFLGKKQAFR